MKLFDGEKNVNSVYDRASNEVWSVSYKTYETAEAEVQQHIKNEVASVREQDYSDIEEFEEVTANLQESLESDIEIFEEGEFTALGRGNKIEG